MPGLLLLVIGLILRYAVSATLGGVNIQTVGDILIFAGIAVMIWFAFTGSGSYFRRW